jgi:DNA invertase Pin-like site-specific DNA recombinase
MSLFRDRFNVCNTQSEIVKIMGCSFSTVQKVKKINSERSGTTQIVIA